MSKKVIQMFQKFDDDFLNGTNKPRDLHAFNLLNQLCPDDQDMVMCAEHDEIWLRPSLEDLEKAGITEEQVRELVKHGVRYDSHSGTLAMFV